VLSDIDIGVSSDSKCVAFADAHAGKERIQIRGNQLLEQGEFSKRIPDWNQARHDWWHLDSGESRFAGGCEPLGLSPLSRLEHHTQVETQVRYIWKRMAWIDGLRGEHRKDVFKKVAIEGSPLAV